ncbi:MAG TPA: ABC transporter ATP-binding protein [Acidisarcina sp.]
MPLIARLDSVSKMYGSFAALKQVSVDLERGCCYLLLGQNGAGKSTLLRVLAGLLRPTFGRAYVFADASKTPNTHAQNSELPADQRHRIGYMSHAPMMYDELSAAENLRYFAGLYGERSALTPDDALKAAGLDPALARPFGQYSQGMRQRASLARALISRPDLLLLDEPFSNMDAASAAQMISLLARLRSEGRSILLTTHQRELAAPLADYFLTLHDGRVLALERASNTAPQTITGTVPRSTTPDDSMPISLPGLHPGLQA